MCLNKTSEWLEVLFNFDYYHMNSFFLCYFFILVCRTMSFLLERCVQMCVTGNCCRIKWATESLGSTTGFERVTEQSIVVAHEHRWELERSWWNIKGLWADTGPAWGHSGGTVSLITVCGGFTISFGKNPRLRLCSNCPSFATERTGLQCPKETAPDLINAWVCYALC